MPIINGTFIDKTKVAPNNNTGGVSAITQNEQLKKALLMAALANPKNASKYSTIFQMLTPSATELKMQEEKKNLEKEKSNKLSDIDRTLALLGVKIDPKTGKQIASNPEVNTGPFAGRMLGLKTKTGIANQKESELYNLLSAISGPQMFEIGGKALTAPERAILAPIIPSSTYGTSTNITNLIQLRNKLSGMYDTYNPSQEVMNTTSQYNYPTPGFTPD